MLKITIDRVTSRLQHDPPTPASTPPRTPSLESDEWKPRVWNPACLPITPPPERGNPVDDKFAHSVEFSLLPSKISPQDEPCVAVIGIGYVGTHLVESFSSVYNVIGFDVSERRISQLRDEASPGNRVEYTTYRDDLRRATHFLISVPTLLREDKTIDSSYLQSALETVSSHARPGATVVIESSVAVGMTRSLLGPLCTSHRLFGGMSPERVDPGRTDPPMRSIPKVVSGLDQASLNSIARLYAPVFDTLVQVSRPEVAEMMKLYENCQRMMNIAFANEMADACLPHGIDPFEVSRAAATKPFGYMPFTPSVGVGGHCIPVNPFYLLSNCEFPLLKAAAEKMTVRPAEIAARAIERVTGHHGKSTSQSVLLPRVLVVGVGFKAGQSVLSNSPGLELATTLARSGRVEVMFADPLVKQEAVPHVQRLPDRDWTRENLEKSFDMIIVAFKQVGIDFDVLADLNGVEVEMWCR
ncbi:hypothetical protein B0H66DRAFT_501005 [Apodospora peruviana]|uniref:Nucleotide sugar dehydrogenase n=1 Tax=Apodospora peruviana TaxID=516989 RepID=A0AAE0M0M9_9PEZI|nr:hypothetical protein B0H66DRAFT_501005 [Apodospora peruviana]